MSTITSIRRAEDGFTLAELIVAMGISLVVLFATLQSFDVFASNAAQQTRATDANDRVRAVMDDTVRDLRGASSIVVAEASNLIYAVPHSGGLVRTERICVSSVDSDLYGFTTVAASSPAAPYPDCNAGTRLARLKSTASTAFTYDGLDSAPASPVPVKNVGLTFSLDSSGGGKLGSSTLRASAARRSSTPLPVTDGDLDATCNELGALLSLSASVADLGPLTVVYESDGGVELGTGDEDSTVQIPPGITKVVARVTNALGLTNIVEKDVECD